MARHYYLVNGQGEHIDSSPSLTAIMAKAHAIIRGGSDLAKVYLGHPTTSDSKVVETIYADDDEVAALRAQLAEAQRRIEELEAEVESHGVIVQGKNNDITTLRTATQETQDRLNFANVRIKNLMDKLANASENERILNLQTAVEELGKTTRLAEQRAAMYYKQTVEAVDKETDAKDRLERMKRFVRQAVQARDVDAIKTICRRAQEI